MGETWEQGYSYMYISEPIIVKFSLLALWPEHAVRKQVWVQCCILKNGA